MGQTACDHGVQVLDWPFVPASDKVLSHDWPGFVVRMWKLSRHEDLRRLAAQMPNHTDVSLLNETVALCEDIERIAHADSALVNRLLEKYVRITPVCEAHGRLLDELCIVGELRRASLASSEDTLRMSDLD